MTRRVRALENVTDCPLAWPKGRDRRPASARRRSTFMIHPSRAVEHLERELRQWPVREFVLSMNVPLDELEQNSSDPGVALWFHGPRSSANKPHLVVFACDAFEHAWENVRAIGLTLQRLRKIEEFGSYGRTQVIENANALPFYGLAATPSSGQTARQRTLPASVVARRTRFERLKKLVRF